VSFLVNNINVGYESETYKLIRDVKFYFERGEVCYRTSKKLVQFSIILLQYIYICVCVCVCARARARVYVHTYMSIYTPTYTRVCRCICICIYMCISNKNINWIYNFLLSYYSIIIINISNNVVKYNQTFNFI
jgi:hypothetical protein